MFGTAVEEKFTLTHLLLYFVMLLLVFPATNYVAKQTQIKKENVSQ
jgi:hypothetical protein